MTGRREGRCDEVKRREDEERIHGEREKGKERKVNESGGVEEEKPNSLSPRDCRPMSDILNRFVCLGLRGKE